MKKHLFPEGARFYKANLHCHTTRSDGALTPDEVKAAFGSDLWELVEKNEILFMPIIYADNIGQMAVFYQWEAQKVRPPMVTHRG